LCTPLKENSAHDPATPVSCDVWKNGWLLNDQFDEYLTLGSLSGTQWRMHGGGGNGGVAEGWLPLLVEVREPVELCAVELTELSPPLSSDELLGPLDVSLLDPVAPLSLPFSSLDGLPLDEALLPKPKELSFEPEACLKKGVPRLSTSFLARKRKPKVKLLLVAVGCQDMEDLHTSGNLPRRHVGRRL
jgi:hypothetical protein